MGSNVLVFMGTPEFAVPSLRRLVEAGYQPTVVTRPDRPKGRGYRVQPPPVKAAARELGLTVLQPGQVRDPVWIKELARLEPQLIVTVAFGQVLPPALLEMPPLGCINLHASLLPKYRGAAPIPRAIMEGERVTGLTTMFMDEGLDTGDIILQRPVEIRPEDDAGSLHDRMAREGAELLLETVRLLQEGRAPRSVQCHELASYAPPLTREDEIINWHRPARAVVDQIRGLSPRPGAYTYHRGKILKVLRASVGKGEGQAGEEPGTVLGPAGERGLEVAAGRGTVWLLEVKPQDSRRMSVEEYVRGHPLMRGDTFAGQA